MNYTIDKNLKAGIELLEKGEKVDQALKLINKSARKGTTKGKSFFEVGKIIRSGIPGLEASVTESKRYFDQAMVYFLKDENLDCLDYLYMGDYYHEGLGTEEVNRDKALEYYKKSLELGNEDAALRINTVEEEKAKGLGNVAPELTHVVKTEAEEETAKVVSEEGTHEEAKAATVAENEKEVEAKETVYNPSKEDQEASRVVADMEEADQLLIKAIRLLDSPASTEADKRKGIEYAKAASDAGVLRAAVLMGYLYEGHNSLLKANLDEAKRYYEIAISRGSASAEYRLGLLYLTDEASYKDEEKGHQLILSSARRGYPYALNYIGDCFRTKVSDPRYLDLAYRYYSLAGERGLGLSYHNMAEIDASRQEIQLAELHERYASDNGYNPDLGVQEPLFTTIRA